jgi:2Fe-2S ferredoxin
MARGKNPFLSEAEERLPTKAYSIQVLPLGITVQVDPANLHGGELGLRGSVLGELLEADIDVDHACGGVLACSTCHVIVRKGYASCGMATEEEEDMLDQAPGVTAQSRLACHCIPDGSSDIVVEIPAWNRNLVKEGH